MTVIAEGDGAASEGGPYSIGSGAAHMEIALQNLLTVGSVTVGDVPSSEPLPESLEGCFSCGVWTHTTDQCQTLDESFPFWPTASGPHWGRVPFETGPRRALKPNDGKRRLIRGEGLVARISNDYEPQLPVVWEGYSWTSGHELHGDCPVFGDSGSTSDDGRSWFQTDVLRFRRVR